MTAAVEEPMPENNDSNELLGLTEKIVSAHVGNNAISSTDLPRLPPVRPTPSVARP
jgi:predicted transcriptional regulator